ESIIDSHPGARPMNRSLVAVLLALAPAPAARAAGDDDWTGQWVFPRAEKLALRDENGKTIGTWSVTAGRVLASDGSGLIRVRNSQYRGPSQGYVKAEEVVKLADAVRFFTDVIQADERDTWAWRMRAEAWAARGEHGKAVEDLTEAIRLAPD